MDRLDDPSGTLGPEAISTTPAEGAKANLQAPLSAGYLRHTVWLRFKVPALPPEHEPGDLWLLAQPTYLDFVTLYQKGSDGAWRVQESGDLVPTDQKPGVRCRIPDDHMVACGTDVGEMRTTLSSSA